MKKRLITLLIAVTLLLTAMIPAQAAITAGEMAVTVNAYCEDYNGVGYKWDGRYYINDTEIYDDSFTIYLSRNDRLDFYSILGEMDSNPDIGEAYDSYRVLARDIRNGFTYTQVVDVMENGGRYRGYWCRWYVDYTFTPLYY